MDSRRTDHELNGRDQYMVIREYYRRFFDVLVRRGRNRGLSYHDAKIAAEEAIEDTILNWRSDGGASFATFLFDYKHISAVARVRTGRARAAGSVEFSGPPDPAFRDIELPSPEDPIAERMAYDELVDEIRSEIATWPRLQDRQRMITLFVFERYAAIGLEQLPQTPGQKGSWATELQCDRADISRALGRIRMAASEVFKRRGGRP